MNTIQYNLELYLLKNNYLKNIFLHLVKSFLTSFNFDKLSGKINNLHYRYRLFKIIKNRR